MAINPNRVKSRLVFSFPGFEGLTSNWFIRRVKSCVTKTAKMWGVSTVSGAVEHHQYAHYSALNLSTTGDDWSVKTRFIQLSFGDLVRAYYDHLKPKIMIANILKLFSFVLDGSHYRYFNHSINFGCYLSFPVILTVLFLALSYFGSNYIVGFVGLTGIAHFVAMALLTVLSFLGLYIWASRQLYYSLSLGVWGHGRDLVNEKSSDFDVRFDDFAKIVSCEINANDYDEIIFAGHSFGAFWAAKVLAIALKKEPNLLEGKRASFLSLGGAIAAVALVRGQTKFRTELSQLFKEKNLFWHDFQSRLDFICFYKVDMFEVLKLGKPPAGYQLSFVNFKRSMNPEKYWNMKKSIYLTHRQYILDQDHCVSFDYYLRVLGPIFTQDLANTPSMAKLINVQKDVFIQDNLIVTDSG
jgi:hypothetical protein